MNPPAAALPSDLSSLCLAITEHAPLPMVTVEGATHIVHYVNPAFCRLMEASAAQLIGRPLSALLPEKDACVALLDRVFLTGRAESHIEEDLSQPHPVFWSYTMWPVKSDASFVGIMIQVTETAKAHGKAVEMNQALMLGSLRQHELTEEAEALNAQLRAEMDLHRRTEVALRESEERYRSLFELIDEGFCVLEKVPGPAGKPPDFRYLEANPAFTTQSGISGMIGKTLQEILPAEAAEWCRIYETVLRTGQPIRFERILAANGRLLELYAFRIKDSGHRRMAVIFKDITERKRGEQELSEKARLLDLSNDAVIVYDLEGKISSWNKGAERLYGWTAAEVLGQDFHTLLQTEFPKPIEEITAQLQKDGQFSGELIQVARDGRRVAALCRKVLDRGTQSILTSYTDITERRILEEALAARAEDLLRADRSKDEFLAMLAHELRNPLAPMRNAAEIMRTPGATTEACDEAQSIFSRQIHNMSRMIDDLLDVSRITEGKIELRKQAVALDAIFSAAASLVRPHVEARGQELAITLPAEPIFLNGDATRLDQVFGNLLNNASKYSEPGCHISISAERAPVHGTEPPEVIVRVRDDGIGIAPEMLPRIFDLFVQATYSLDRARGGLGIGLTLVQRLVRLHGGSVEAHSAGLGHGSEFIVRLPILAIPAHVPPPPQPAPARETPCRMLIVDDNEDSARSMAMLQRMRGHDARTAFTGPEALIAAAEFIPEVVLLDIGLPGMDGYEVAHLLRAMPALAGALIVALTGYDSEEDRAHAQEAGFDEYLVKPVNTKILRAWLQDKLDRRKR